MSAGSTSLKDHISELAVASHEASRSQLFEIFTDGIARALGADFVEMLEYLGAEGAFVLKCGRGLPDDLEDRARVPGGLLSQAGRAFLDPTGHIVELEDVSHPHDWVDSELLLEHGVKSGVAIRVEEGDRPFGVLGAFYSAPREFSSEERHFLDQTAGLLGAGLQRLRREREAASWRSRSELLRSGALLVKVPAERDAVLFAAAAAGVGAGPGGALPMADWCAADALEADGRRPRLSRVGVAHAGGDAEKLEDSLSVPLAPSAPHGAERVYATRRPELVPRCDEAFIRTLSRDPEHRHAVDEVRPFSYICAPVMGTERFYGAITFIRTQSGNPAPFDEEDLTACSEFGGLVATAIERGEPGPDTAEAQEAVRSHAGGANFTDRELEVLLGIASGERLAQIGRKHSISIHTVRNHKRSLCAKLGLSPSVPDARIIAEARRRGAPNLST